MPGTSSRKGAVRKSSKAAPKVGSGGRGRKGLEGRGPTPRAEVRVANKNKGKPAPKGAESKEGRTRPGAAKSGPGAKTQGPKRTGSDPTNRTRGTTKPGARGPAPRAARSGSKKNPHDASEMVAGRNPVVEALRARVPASTLYVALRVDADDRIRECLKLAGDRNIPLLEVPRPELDRMCDGASHQGIALRVPPYAYAHPDDLIKHGSGTPLIVMLDGVTDPRNLGAVIRSTAAFGGTGVVVPERRAAGVTASAWKSSAGAASRVRVARAANLTRALEAYKAAGLFVVGLDGDGEMEVSDVEVATDPLVLVVGSEGKGLSRLVQQTCDLVVRIPIAADTESLNASVATSVALYEVARRRR